MRILHLIVAGSLALPLVAAEDAVLANGARLHADRHEAVGSRVRLFSAGGVTELPGELVVRFEAVDEIVPRVDEILKPVAIPVAPVVSAAPRDLASAAARKYALPQSFVASVMRVESGFQAKALSPKGAIGLMQLMPATARELGVNPNNPSENAEGGAQYLHDLLAKYEDKPDQVLLALAAYNAGPAAVEKYHGVPPYRETREYILRVLKGWDPSQPPR